MNELSFIGELTESKLLPSRSSARRYTAKDVCDLLFLSCIGLQVLKGEFDTLSEAADYAGKTLRYGTFDERHFSCTDLYVLVHLSLHGEPKDFKKNPSNESFLRGVNVDQPLLRRWLRSIRMDQPDEELDRRTLLMLQNGLRISDQSYRAMRRLSTHWGRDIEEREKKLVITRLLLALRARASRSELRPHLERLAKRGKLELPVPCNPETGSCERPKRNLLGKLALASIGGAVGGVAAARHARRRRSPP